jgi:hypothetical protein
MSLEVQSHRRGNSEMGQYKSPHRKERFIEVSEMIKTNPQKISTTFVQTLNKAGWFKFGREKNMDFVSRIQKREAALKAPSDYSPRLNLFNHGKICFYYGKDKRVTAAVEESKRKEWVPSPDKYDVKKRPFYKTTGNYLQ